MTTRQPVARPRLVELLATRWQRRAVTLTAGTGFGKSVLLAQASAENTLDPRGLDVPLVCTPDDCCPTRLLRAIAQAAGPMTGRTVTGRPVGADEIVAFLGDLASRSAIDVCLVLDDVHHLAADERGARLLADLVVKAPPCVHFVLAGRTRVRGLASGRATGDVADLDEGQLAFSPAELAVLAARHGAHEPTLATTGGWPALAALVAGGAGGTVEYLQESVVDGLDAGGRATLAVAAVLGNGDLALLGAAVGCDAELAATRLVAVPLAAVADRTFSVHPVWRAAVPDLLDAAHLAAALDRAVDELVGRSEFDRAFQLCSAYGDWAHAGRVVAACGAVGHAPVSPTMLSSWLAALPAERHDAAEGLLLRGLLARVADPFGASTGELLERAMQAARSEGNVAGEIAAGVALLVVLRNQGRFDGWPAFLARAAELDAAGHREAAGPAAVGRALLAEQQGDDALMLAELAAIPAGSLSSDWQVVAMARRVMGHLVLGDDGAMLDAAAECAALAGDGRDRHLLALAEWFAGRPDRAVDSVAVIAADGRETLVSAVLFGSFAAVVLAHAGRIDDARRELAFIERARSGTMGPLMRGALLWASATIAVAAGDDGEARRLIEDELHGASLDDPTTFRMIARALPLAYVLVPSLREELDHRPLGPLHRRRLDVARAVAWAHTGQASPTSVPADLDVDAVATTVPLPWAMALAGALRAAGRARGRAVVEQLAERHGEPVREALRATADHRVARTADGARKLSAAVAFSPSRAVRLGVLGPLELHVGGVPTDDPHWSRERVRSLLLYFAVHRRAHRDQIIDALWPHLDPVAADRNLRVTLTYLNQVLEPDRRSGEAPYFVRQDCSTLTLVDSPFLELDAGEFDDLLDRAEDADRRGLPSIALDLLGQALARWRGPCLHEVVYEEWAQSRVHALTTRFVDAAVRAAELSLAAGRHREAQRHAGRALTADEWSEAAHRMVVAAALAAGDRSAAHRALDRSDAVLASLGLEPSPETDLLRRRVHAAPGPRASGLSVGPIGWPPTDEQTDEQEDIAV